MKLLQVPFNQISANIPELDIPLPVPLDSEGIINALSEVISAPGLLRPLIILYIDFEEYQLVDSSYEYFALAKHFEENPCASNSINCVVIYADEYDEAIKQLEVFEKLDSRPRIK